ncbi:YciI family protein [Shinella zoogloeoides]|uniref:YciI family protein n=1 Tax=Shinella zoogloeoides TaxID=352475 RepID=UPI00273D2310|nr:YciI family protein [Shinella zoogloeoides]WLR91498.1 YciI family protein [Shinella zoogloeoides]
MLYAVLCYDAESEVNAWSKELDDKVMADLGAVNQRYAEAGKLGPVARLMPTTAAVTVRKGVMDHIVMDGPFAETKEQFLGFFVLEAETLEEAITFARELSAANPANGTYEIRPLQFFNPGVPIT